MQPSETLTTYNPERARLTRNDWIGIAASIAVLVGSFLFVRANYRAAFPQASLDLSLSKDEITAKAEQFLKTRGLDPKGFRNLTLFDPDDDARLFLEREAGLEKANQLMSSGIAVWRWRARWYKPPEKEEFAVYLSPSGKLTRFDHVISEVTPGARIEQPRAREIASDFLRSQTTEQHKLVEEKKEQRPNRDDYTFTWELEGFRIAGADYRRSVTIHGDRIGAYSEFLHVPEQWQRDFTAMRSKNQLYAQIAQAFYVPLMIVAVIVLVQGLRRHDIRWKPLIAVSATVGAAMAANQLNMLPFTLDRFPTSSPVSTSLGIALLQALGAGTGVFFYVAIAALPGETLYRRMFPGTLSLRAAFSKQGLQSREFFNACVSGYGFAGLHMIFLVGFYLITKRFGAWTPQDVEYSDLLSTAVPWLYPLGISLMAGFSEEFWFRLLALPLVKRLTGSTLIAVTVPAFVWGFLHANYPQQPAYVRGIEVGLIGVGASLLMLKRGIVSTLVWHYTIDAALIGTILFASPSWYFRLSGLAVAGAALIPLGAAIFLYRRNGGFLEDPSLLNASIVPASEPPPLPASELLPPLRPTWPAPALWITAAVLFVAGLLFSAKPFGAFIEVAVDREQALAAPGSLDPEWRAHADFAPNLSAETFEYLRRTVGRDEADRLVRKHTLTGVWRVRRFQDQKPEEWHYFVDQRRSIVRVDHVLDEKAPGESLSLDQATVLAHRHLSSQGLDPSQLRLIDAASEKRENRVDHSFEWEDPAMRAGEAKARVKLTIQGNEPTQFRRYIKLPEAWLREYHKPRFQSMLLPAIGGGLVLTVIFAFLRQLGGLQAHWRVHAIVAIVVAAISVLSESNDAVSFFASYDTRYPVSDFTGDRILSIFMRTLLAACAAGFGSLALETFLKFVQGSRQLPGADWRNALAVGAGIAGLGRLLAGIEQHIPGDRLSPATWGITGLESSLPAFDILANSAIGAIFLTIAAGLACTASIALFPPRRRWVYGAVLLALLALSRAISWQMFLYSIASTALLIGLASLYVRTAAADLLAFAAGFFVVQTFARAQVLTEQPSNLLRTHGYAAMIIALIIAAAWLWRFRPSPSAVPPEPRGSSV